MHIQSARFGQLEISEEDILRFPHGLPGFADETAFVLLPYQPDSPFSFLQSLQEPNLTFLVVDPFFFFKDYEFELNDSILEEFKLSAENTPQIFNIVRVPQHSEEMTANLLAPIVINWRDHIAVQVVLEKTGYTTRHRLFPQNGNSEKGEK